MTDYPPVHPDRYQLNGIMPKKGTVIHTSESSPTSYASLRRYVTFKGDKPSPSRPGQFYGSSYHALTRNDPEASYDQILDGVASPYSAPPLNASWWHICMPGNSNALGTLGTANYRPALTRETWLQYPMRQGILAVAKFIVDHGTTAILCSISDLQLGYGGYTSHNNVSLAFRKSNHTDPGRAFPWDVLAQDISDLKYDPPILIGDDVLVRVMKPTFSSARPEYPWLGFFDSGLVRPTVSNDMSPTEKNPDPASGGVWPLPDEAQYRMICSFANIKVPV